MNISHVKVSVLRIIDLKSKKNDKKIIDNIRYRAYVIHIGNTRKKIAAIAEDSERKMPVR